MTVCPPALAVLLCGPHVVAVGSARTLTAEDASRLRGLREIVIGKLSKRGVDLRNVEQVEPAISPLGHARQELKIQQGLEGDKAKEAQDAGADVARAGARGVPPARVPEGDGTT